VADVGVALSADVGQCRQCHIRVGHGRKCGVAVGIASPSVSVQKLFPLPVSTSGFVADTCVSDVGQRRAVSAVSFLSRAWSKMWGSRWNRFAMCFVQSYSTSGFHFRFHGDIRVSVVDLLGMHGRCRSTDMDEILPCTCADARVPSRIVIYRHCGIAHIFRPTPGLVEFHFRSRGMRY